MPVMESKAADVFAFGMFAVEVFTGKLPFGAQKNEAVVLRISQGGRPEFPANAQAIGLTVEIWNLLQSCWKQDPKKRPTMAEVVRRWQRFVGDDDDLAAFPKCVQATLVISTSPSIRFSTFLIDSASQNMQRKREKALVDAGERRRLMSLKRRPLTPDSGQ